MFSNTYKFCNDDINKFILLLRRGIYPYKYIDSWKRFDETVLPNNRCRYYRCWLQTCRKIYKKFKIKNLSDYYDLYVLSDTLLLADVLKNFTNKCTEIYELDPANFLSVPGLAWQVCLKKRRKIRIINRYQYFIDD